MLTVISYKTIYLKKFIKIVNYHKKKIYVILFVGHSFVFFRKGYILKVLVVLRRTLNTVSRYLF